MNKRALLEQDVKYRPLRVINAVWIHSIKSFGSEYIFTGTVILTSITENRYMIFRNRFINWLSRFLEEVN